jgi:F420-dependent oxidoreductase-like protein
MRLSISLTNYSWPAEPPEPPEPPALADRLAATVRVADDAGLDTVWVPDHLMQGAPGTTPEQEMLEAYTTLGFLAAQTTRVRLGTMVSGVTFRPPSLLIKAVTTLDVLSRGRAWFGVGAGYHEAEAAAMGLSLPPTGERFDRLEEVLRLALQMWSGDDSPFDSAHYRLGRPLNSPNSVQRPHPPILVGGTGERRTLRLVAAYADACNIFDVPDGGKTITHKLGVLARHCEDVGRDYAEISKTVSTRLGDGEPPEAFAARCAELAQLGLDHVVVITSGPWTEQALETLAAARPTVSGI